MKFFSHGILGMNARNLKYIRTKNSAASVSLADSKLKTKTFLGNRGIPFAQTYAVLASQQELKNFSFGSIRADGFVVKPNKGSRWRGILIVRRDGEGYLVQGEPWTEEELRLQMTDILRGSFSLHGSSDSVVIEELLAPGREFAPYCRFGLADIRVIVYNHVPVAAMVRMPSEESDGKANLDLGSLWLGLNISRGNIVTLYQHNTTHADAFPAGFEHLKGRTVPFWDDILLLSSQIQTYTQLGFLGLDWVITKDGPKLLEINARAGLKIQNVNLIGLESRLKKVGDLKILTPEKGVEIAKTLFHTDTVSSATSGKKVLYFRQRWTVSDVDVSVTVDPAKTTSAVSKDIAEISKSGSIRILTEHGVSVLLERFEVLDGGWSARIVLARQDIRDFLIDPGESPDMRSKTSSERWSRELLDYDADVHRASKKVNLSSLLKPENYFRALDAFANDRQRSDPIFEYRFPEAQKVASLREEIARLAERGEALKRSGQTIADLYLEKLFETSAKLSLVESYREEDFEMIRHFNEVLFGKTDPALLERAKKKVFEPKAVPRNDETILGRRLALDEIVGEIERYFEQHGLKKIPISIESGNLSRMSVSYGKEVKIHISKNAVIRQNEIDPILAHEIGTHFQRYLSGERTGLKIFQYGTGFYLSDEEWLAIHRSFAHLPEGYEKNAMYVKYYLLATVDTLSFGQTVELLTSLYPEKPIESIFADAVRLKRGLIHSGTKGTEWTTYQKDKIYLDGYHRVSEWIRSWGDQERLLAAKIKIRDLTIFENL